MYISHFCLLSLYTYNTTKVNLILIITNIMKAINKLNYHIKTKLDVFATKTT